MITRFRDKYNLNYFIASLKNLESDQNQFFINEHCLLIADLKNGSSMPSEWFQLHESKFSRLHGKAYIKENKNKAVAFYLVCDIQPAKSPAEHQIDVAEVITFLLDAYETLLHINPCLLEQNNSQTLSVYLINHPLGPLLNILIPGLSVYQEQPMDNYAEYFKQMLMLERDFDEVAFQAILKHIAAAQTVQPQVNNNQENEAINLSNKEHKKSVSQLSIFKKIKGYCAEHFTKESFKKK